MTTLPITLRGVKTTRTSSTYELKFETLLHLTGIPKARMTLLESMNVEVAEEPWLDEAHRISCVLRNAPLMLLVGGTIDKMADLDTGFDLADPVAVWKRGCRLPLRYGIRLALLWGLNSPFDLLTITDLDRQRWQMVTAGERAGGLCGWCGRDPADHAPTCIPSVLHGPRDAELWTIGAEPKPWRPHVRRGGSRVAPGLRPLRDKHGLTQQQMADKIGIARSSYYRIEKLHDPLTSELGATIASLFKVSIDSLYPFGTDEPTLPSSH